MDRRLPVGVIVAIAWGLTPAVASAETISGHVTGPSSENLEGICVAAHNPADPSIPGGVVGAAGTDASGNYTMTVPAGSWVVSFRTGGSFGCGTSTTPVVTEYYNDKSDFASADQVPVGSGAAVTGIDAQLAFPPTAGAISGRLTNTLGAGVPNVCAAALDSVQAVIAFGVTDASGDYTISGLPAPSSYRVVFSVESPCPATGARTFTEYYNDRSSFALADPVAVTSGGTTTGVNAVLNSKPTATDDSVNASEGMGAHNYAVLANDTDIDTGDAIEIEGVTTPTNGSASITQGSPDTITYTPNAPFCGTDSFDYTVNGGDTATVTVTINCAPTAVADAATVVEDSGANTIDVVANDTDTDGGLKFVAAKTNGGHGAVAITGGSAFVQYTPHANYCGPDSFTYDLNGGSQAIVTVTVTCVDDNPVAVNDSATAAEDAGAIAVDVRANDTDVDGGAKTVASKTDGAHGAVAITNGGNDVSYTPAANYCGADSFTYTLNGGSTGTVNVTVTCADDVPSAVGDSATVAEDASATGIDVLANDTDPDGGPKTVESVTNGVHGTAASASSGAAVTYTPAAGFCGADSFTYTLNGGAVATVSMTVTCVDDVPVPVDDARTVAERAPATAIDVLANDTDSDGGPKTITSVSDPAHGTAAITDSGAALTYTPDANYCGRDTFSYVLNAGASAAVNITVPCVAPQTTITRAPKPTVTITGARARVRFRFRSNEAGSTFRCKLDRGPFRPCSSPKGYRLKPGRHTFRVVATDAAGNVDPTPARKRVRVVVEPD